MERDDLLLVLVRDWQGNPTNVRPVSDADLASLGYIKAADATMIWNDAIAREAGYVKLDGIDVEALIRRAIDAASEADGGLMPTEGTLKALWVGIPAALAAIDQEDTP